MTRVLITFALILASCTTPSATPSATPTAVPSATTTASTAVATSSVVGSDPGRYGLVVPEAGRIVVRAERSTDAIIATGGDEPAASPDGRRIAFWRSGPQGSNRQELRVIEVPSAVERTLMALPGEELGGKIVWSSDGTGLLYESHRLEPIGVTSAITSSRLHSFDLLANQPAATDSPLVLTTGYLFVPLGWDRAGALSAALTSTDGGGALDYVIWDRGAQPVAALKSTPFPWPVDANTVQASFDAKRILAIDHAANVLRVWPAADIATADMLGPGAAKLVDARWRPGTSAEIAWVLDQNVEVFTYRTSRVATVHRAQDEVRIFGWRVDGSGIVLSDARRGAVLVELPSGQATVLPAFGLIYGSPGAVLLR